MGHPFANIGQRAVRFAGGFGIRAGFVGREGVVELGKYERTERYIFQGKVKEKTSNERTIDKGKSIWQEDEHM